MEPMQQTITIAGMTCQNCVRHVTQALLEIPGVSRADVSLADGRATIASDREVPRAEIAAALAEDGYELT